MSLLLLLVWSGMAWAAAPLVYRDPGLHYAISYDPGYAFKVSPEPNVPDHRWQVEFDRNSQYFTLDLTVTSTSKSDTADVCQDMAWKVSKSASVQGKPTPFKGLPGAYEYGYTWTYKGVDTRDIQYVVLNHKGLAFIFTATTYPEQFDLNRVRWEKILSTFRFQ